MATAPPPKRSPQRGRAEMVVTSRAELVALEAITGPVAMWLGRMATELRNLGDQRKVEDNWRGWRVRIIVDWEENQ